MLQTQVGAARATFADSLNVSGAKCMRYFLDTEFIEDGRTIELLSLALVAEDGREYYAEDADADLTRANAWVHANVVPQLGEDPAARRPRECIRTDVHRFIVEPDPEIWGYYAAYDWVAFTQLFGDFDAYNTQVPPTWPRFCLDIEQWRRQLGRPDFPKMTATAHHALHDARWVRDMHCWLAGG